MLSTADGLQALLASCFRQGAQQHKHYNQLQPQQAVHATGDATECTDCCDKPHRRGDSKVMRGGLLLPIT
jgi:hypothetical protein